MAEFRRSIHGAAATSKLLVTSKAVTLFVVAPSAESVAVISANPAKLTISGLTRLKNQSLPSGQALWQFNMQAVSADQIDVTAEITGTSDKIILQVTIEDPIQLPDEATDSGALARLFLHENLSPYFKSIYKEKDCLKGMQWMRNVMENRRNKKPELFGLKQGVSIAGMFKNASQFGDLSTYPKLTDEFAGTLALDLNIAQDDSNPNQQAFAAYVRNAISVAASPEPLDPSPNGLFFWRTQGSGSPGGQAVEYLSVSGNTFYSIK